MTYTELSSTNGEAQTIVDTALLAAKPNELEAGKVYAWLTHRGVEQVDLTGDQYKDKPDRKRGTTTVRDAASFLAHYGKHADGDSEVYADAEKLTITAVLDADTADSARWGGHRLHLALRETEAWKQWIALDGKLMHQEQFAEFIEDHLPELLEPAAAEMLEIAQSIQGVAKAEFQSGTRLSSGERKLAYIETVTAKAGQKGELVIPETFVIGLVPFEGSEGYKLTARLRYRINGGPLQLGYKLERPGDIRRTAFTDVVDTISDDITVPVLNGTPA
ncbi:YfdQ family protein [Streptomyces sp. DSM 40750]|uniref:YfdQ family protein n=1 Tax=Streptomyces sp. DSM 40750 TaxID=2801030 RepID=UPI00214CD81E|nr:YfdQ family protein [Streptomyces sp. DSM 40750]UUU21686.1 YfdQ family protein [Streptomyces sp. DSM 40750]